MDLRVLGLLCCLVLAGCLSAPQGSNASGNASGNPTGNASQIAPAGNQSAIIPSQPDCSSDNAKPTLGINYEVRGPDYLRIILSGQDSDNDSLVYALSVTDTSGNPIGNLSLNPDKTYTWTYTTGFARYVVATASVSDTRNGQICSTVTQNQTIQAVIHNTEGNATGG